VSFACRGGGLVLQVCRGGLILQLRIEPVPCVFFCFFLPGGLLHNKGRQKKKPKKTTRSHTKELTTSWHGRSLCESEQG
jgi:hypothetical protein